MSTGGIIGAVVGGAVGFFIGGPMGAVYGASLGFGAGMMLDPITPDRIAPGTPSQENPVMTSTIGDPCPDLCGSAKVVGHLLWYGNERTEAVYSEGGAAAGGKGGPPEPEPQITGYKYYMTWGLGICRGPINSLLAIYINDDTLIYEGPLDLPASGGQETIVIDNFGSITFYYGTTDQVANSTAATIIDSTLNSPLRGYCWAVCTDCYIGEYPRTPTLSFVVKKIPTYSFSSGNTIQEYDCNPSHALYYVLNTLSGLPTSWLYDSEFGDIATTLYEEYRGISILFKDSNSALSYINNIVRHIDAVIRYGNDGQFHPKLIRDDYTPSTLPVVNEDDLLDDPELKRGAWIDSLNEIKIQYTDIFNVTRPKVGNVNWYCCGFNQGGGLGLNDKTIRLTLVQNSLIELTKIYSGAGSSYGTKLDGSFYVCGVNAKGQLGLGDITERLVFTDTGLIASDANGQLGHATGDGSTIVIASGGYCFTSGWNQYRQLAVGDNSDRNSFTAIRLTTGADDLPDPGGWISCCMGAWGSSGLVSSGGALYTAGYNVTGSLGQGTFISGYFPRFKNIVADPGGWTKVTSGPYANMFAIRGGALYSCGSSANGANGLGSSVNVFTAVSGMTNISDVQSGENFTIALKLSGTIWATGTNGDGRTGQNTTAGFLSSFTQIGTDTDWAKIAVGHDHAIALKSDGTLWGWGNGGQGALGSGGTTDYLVPTQIGSDSDWIDITAGYGTTFVRKG